MVGTFKIITTAAAVGEGVIDLENQHCSSIETLRKDRKTNYFTFNVYI